MLFPELLFESVRTELNAPPVLTNTSPISGPIFEKA